MNFLLHVTCSCIPHAYVLFFQYICYIWNVLGIFWLSLSLPLVLFTLVMSMAPKRNSIMSQNPLHSRASTSSNPTPSHSQFHDEDAQKDFSKNFSRRGGHSELFLMSFTIGVRSHCVTSQSLVLPCWSGSFTPSCMDSIRQYLSFILAFEVRTLLSH